MNKGVIAAIVSRWNLLIAMGLSYPLFPSF
ncbi:MAG: hypothetical protein CM1200mP28_17390 [Deltaproteobacteria bacterium]|nr:MAG: hypothetical protein CM1200mP28_17390 [Deltaproteobacteria bacterium]